jgi:hypothetical protein
VCKDFKVVELLVLVGELGVEGQLDGQRHHIILLKARLYVTAARFEAHFYKPNPNCLRFLSRFCFLHYSTRPKNGQTILFLV